MGKKNQKKKFVKVDLGDQKWAPGNNQLNMRQDSQLYSAPRPTNSSRSSYDRPRESNEDWRKDNSDGNNRGFSSRNWSSGGKPDSYRDHNNFTKREYPEQEESSRETSVLCTDNVGSTEAWPSTTLESDSSYDVNHASAEMKDMSLERDSCSRSSWTTSNIRDSNDGNSDARYSNYGRNQRLSKNDSPENNERNWRSECDNQTERPRTSYADHSRGAPKVWQNSRDRSSRDYQREGTRTSLNGSNSSNSFDNGRWGTSDRNSREFQGERSRISLNISKDSSNSFQDTSKERSRPSLNLSKDSSNSFQDSPKERSRTSFGNYYKREVFSDVTDEEKKEFVNYLDTKQADDFKIVQEEERDLFEVGKDYALAHCVAEDMNMGSGIAVEFRSRFKKVAELLAQNVVTGGLAILEDGSQFIYYLVTKARSQGKPTYDTLWSSLMELRTHMKNNEVKKLAIPRIGCGLDRLDWNIVKPMLEFVFRGEELDILVCNLQVDGPTTTPFVKKSKVVLSPKAVTEIEPQTLILYFASEDGTPTDVMKNLDKKFNFANQFQTSPKILGETFRSAPSFPKSYILYGCIVRKTQNDPFDFIAFDKCLRTIKKNYKTDNFYFAAFQKTSDELLDAKILNMMKHTLNDLEIHICGYASSNFNVDE